MIESLLFGPVLPGEVSFSFLHLSFLVWEMREESEPLGCLEH